jgi:hypothetical protein
MGVLVLGRAWAQRSGNGLFQGASICSDVTGQIANQTFCLDYSSGTLSVWNGSSYQLLTGLSTVRTSGGTLNFPDGSTYTSAGHNNMKALGVGYAAPATTGWIQNSGVLGVGLTIPTDATGGLLTSTAGIFSPSSSSTAFQIFDAGIYPTSGGYKISSNDGSLFHMVENGTEFGIFIDNGQTTGSIWNNSRTQYLALRSTANTGSGPGLYLESGPIEALNGGIVSGAPTGNNKGTGTFNGTSYYVNGSQLTQVSLGTVASMGSASVFHISNSTLNCSLTFDGLGSGHAMATCNISITWSSITGQNGSVVNIGYLPWVAASTANNSWFHVSYVSGYSGTVGCWLTATLNPGQSWVTIAYVGPTSACGASGGWLPDTNFAQTGGISLIGQYLVQ